ncbi:hypothetical protein MAR_004077 [Mya arenaria]|uniref:Uncharacterized protein n=1 Tax=Mya arenaria TaxID=6604 RepID=A0ABY7EVI6_MYAAR|nr:hypothetical protein MAR_004077 [Mya arenaria]
MNVYREREISAGRVVEKFKFANQQNGRLAFVFKRNNTRALNKSRGPGISPGNYGCMTRLFSGGKPMTRDKIAGLVRDEELVYSRAFDLPWADESELEDDYFD